jgi:hypothetical protein
MEERETGVHFLNHDLVTEGTENLLNHACSYFKDLFGHAFGNILNIYAKCGLIMKF